MSINFSGIKSVVLLYGLMVFLSVIVFSQQAFADKRHPDPDGCFSCHGLPDLKYIDKEGQIRSATILKADYYGSLHGSVPCKDCHRKITDYPHEEKDGLVNCGEKCHVKEPSEGKAFTHEDVVKEFEKSVHGKGLSKDFAAGNRFKEENDSSLPSCRRCHANVPYIAASQWDAFKDAFAHNDAECGTCHQGDTWMNQYSGHILRRFVGNRINKNESNAMCIECHGNLDKMEKVEIEDPKTKEKKRVDLRFVHTVGSYEKTLHARLLEDKSFDGASCVDCHAPGGLHHGILRDENVAASTHVSNLPQTCGQAGCHKGYAQSVASKGFLLTDLHNAAWIGVNAKASVEDLIKIPSTWKTAFYIFGPLCALFMLGSLYWGLFGDVKKLNKNANNSLLGAEKFQTIIIGSKGKQSAKETGRWFKFKLFIGALFGNQNSNTPSSQATKSVAQSHKAVEKPTAAVAVSTVPEQVATTNGGVTEAGALARMERKRLRAEAAAAAATGDNIAQSQTIENAADSSSQQTMEINSGSTEAGMLARMERKRKRAEAAAAVGGGEVTPPVHTVPILDSNTEILEEAKPELVLNSGSTEAGMLARMERKRLRAEAAAKQAAGGETTDSEKPK